MKIKLDLSPEYSRDDTSKGVTSKAEITFDTFDEALDFHQKLVNLVKAHRDEESTKP